MIKHKDYEWAVIIAAFLYEIDKSEMSLLSDSSYDSTCKYIEAIGSTIPDFNSNTGQWIYKLIKNKDYLNIIINAINRLQVYNNKGKTEGTAVSNLINKKYLL